MAEVHAVTCSNSLTFSIEVCSNKAGRSVVEVQ
jgi:hypothetical protein